MTATIGVPMQTLWEHLQTWPPGLMAGVLFFVLWIPIVLIAAAAQWFLNRGRIGDSSDWVRGTALMLALGAPCAVGFGVVFALEGLIGGGIVVSVAFGVVCIVLVGWLLPRLMRW